MQGQQGQSLRPQHLPPPPPLPAGSIPYSSLTQPAQRPQPPTQQRPVLTQPTTDRKAEFNQLANEAITKLFNATTNYIPKNTQNEMDLYDDILFSCRQKYILSLEQGSTKNESKSKMVAYAKTRFNNDFNVDIPNDVIGSGLMKRRGRPKGCGIKKTFNDYVDPDAGIKSKTPFVSFGKHLINSNKLYDGVISLRHKSGAGLPNLPARKVSPNLANIIKTIVGGGMPSYNEVDKLTDEEKNYLHQISKKSDLTQMLAIPTPSKDKMEKDFNQFEIMKGEIMAGNDSKDLIKKFKVLLLKLVNTGQLPKAQVQEIMTELLEMGY